MFEDEYQGKGGSYIVDPQTGKRIPESQFLAQTQPIEQGEALAEPVKEKPAKKTKGGE